MAIFIERRKVVFFLRMAWLTLCKHSRCKPSKAVINQVVQTTC